MITIVVPPAQDDRLLSLKLAAKAAAAVRPAQVGAGGSPQPRIESAAQREWREFEEGRRSAAVLLGKTLAESAGPAAERAPISTGVVLGGSQAERDRFAAEYKQGRRTAAALLGKKLQADRAN